MLTIHPNTKPWHSFTLTTLHTPSSFPFKTKILPTKITNTINENNRTEKSSAGNIKRLVLPQEGRTKLDTFSDREFYAYPRFVTHVDDGFISTLTNLYRERLRPGSEILDLMSSWVSHVPKEVEFKRVVGHGLNAQELAKNPRLDYFFVKDLNQEQKFELESCSFDAVLCTVSVQYLQQPEKCCISNSEWQPLSRLTIFLQQNQVYEINVLCADKRVFAEVFRILRPGGVFIVSFSNRMFYEKAIRVWRDGTAYSRVQLVVQYFQCVEGFTQPEIVRKLAATSGAQENKSAFSWIMGLLGIFSGSDPFYAVIAYKNFKPVYE